MIQWQVRTSPLGKGVSMADGKLRLIGTLYVPQYKTEAKLYIEDTRPLGHRCLVAQYEKGGYDGDREFTAEIPDRWTDEEVLDMIFWPMKDPKASYPAWEFPARAYGSPELFRWWADVPRHRHW
jgi:hypothetical protein